MIYIVSAADPTPALAGGDGSEAFTNERKVTKFYRERRRAENAAKLFASKYPGELFAVFEAKALYEAKAPEIMEKVFTAQGEIVPKGD